MESNQSTGRRLSRLIIVVFFAVVVALTGKLLLVSTPQKQSKELEVPESEYVQHSFSPIDNVTVLSESAEVNQQIMPVISAKPKVKNSTDAGFIFAPPLTNMIPSVIVANVNPSVGGNIESETGSLVQIPPNAFVDVNGKKITGTVKVSFSEYRDYKDIFLSGIPMTYTVDGTENQFESAGMMQLTASANNQQVFVNPGKTIKVMLASDISSKDYNLYYFDTSTGNWVEKGKDQVTYKRKNLVRENKQLKVAAYEPVKRSVNITSFESIPEDKVFLWWSSPAKVFDFSFIRLSKSYPELKALAAMKWEYRGLDAKEVYSRLFNVPPKVKGKSVRYGTWNSVSVAPGREELELSLTFKNDVDSVTVFVRPKDRGEKSLIKHKKRMVNYSARLNTRVIADQNHYKNYQRDSTDVMNGTGLPDNTRLEVMRTFMVDNFGVWNVDKILNNEKFVVYRLKLTDENQRPLKVKALYLVDKEFNSVFTFNVDKNQEVRINPFSTNLLWAILPGNRLAVAGPSRIWELSGKKGNQQLMMQVNDDALTSIEDVREQLNF